MSDLMLEEKKKKRCKNALFEYVHVDRERRISYCVEFISGEMLFAEVILSFFFFLKDTS